ncbi:GNAT family N-acetyltransferase [Paenibacillus sp. P25]|nr:GNAT family N-acetyltransferase [Paenibacillus sp. P25]
MHGPVFLVEPSTDYQEAYISFYEEWKQSGEDIVPWVVTKDPYDFSGMVRFLREGIQAASENLVPHTTYWLVNEEKKVLGAVNIRHRLNAKLLNSGGHIGYGIRPSERRKGLATALLHLALQKTRELGLDQVLVVCDKGNIGSERTILKNGGVFDSEYMEPNGNIVRRFWIPL